MEQSDIEDAAMFLLHLRTQRSQVAGLPGELAPKTVEQAYDIQDATHKFAGWPLEVLKVGCTSEVAQQVLGIPHPIGGRIPSEGVFETGSTVPSSFLASEPLLECEIALRVNAVGKVDAAAPAIELVNPRFLDTSKVAGASLIADNSAGCGVVVGEPVPIADAGDLSAIAMTLHDGNDEIAAGSAQALADGAQGSVDWTLAHESSRGREIAAGTWIITGTCTGLTPTQFDRTYTATFSTLGSVSFKLGE